MIIREMQCKLEKLERPFGVIRYARDSYQSGNYWIKAPGSVKKDGAPALTDDASSDALFTARLANLMPDTEAQWFFDSKLAMIRAHMAKHERDPIMRQQDIFFRPITFEAGTWSGNRRPW